MSQVGLKDIQKARREIQGRVVRTPLIPFFGWPGKPEAQVFLKLENLQRTGSFKVRGAFNRMAHLTPGEVARGVITASAGNHAQGVALAAKEMGIRATIIMPEPASPAKVAGTRALGAKVVLKGRDYQEAYEEAQRVAAAEGLVFIHPYEDPLIIAGQGTVGLEILEDLPDVGTVIAGVGGGGLLSGIALALAGRRKKTRIIGVQPKATGNLLAALKAGKPVTVGPSPTLADGLATRHVGDLTFSLLKKRIDQVFEVSESEIATAVFFLLEKARVLAEGSGAAPVAALMAHPELLDHGPVVAVISGGNIDPFLLDSLLWRGLASQGRVLRVLTVFADRPGMLAGLLKDVASLDGNVVRVRHERESPFLNPGEVAVEVEIEVRDREHARAVLAGLKKHGWSARSVPFGPS